MSISRKPNRRQFIQATAATAAMAAPTIVSARAFAGANRLAPSDKVIVGSIGVGDLGRRHHLANMLLKNPRVEVAAVCDVDGEHRAAAQEEVKKQAGRSVEGYNDFRDVCDRTDIDAVLIAVPDHWHALTAIYAMESGKDVYCEKPLSYTVEEGQAMVAAARRYGTVFQTGSQQRSDRRFRQSCELVRNGKIGRLQRVDTHVGNSDAGEWKPVTAPPTPLDWNFWLGPAPYRDYMENMVHYQFRWFSDFSGGKLTDWGAHHNDIAQWGIGADGSGPVKVKGAAKFLTSGPHDVAAQFDIDLTYENGVVLTCHSGGENGVKFTGSDGWIFVSRGKIEASNPEILKYEFGGSDVRLYNSSHHHNNWLDCIQTRERPICDVEVGHRSASVCHLCNIAVRLGRELRWDPKTEQFVGDDQANLLLSRPMRSPWHL